MQMKLSFIEKKKSCFTCISEECLGGQEGGTEIMQRMGISVQVLFPKAAETVS